jgi:hypothetical protein
MFSRFLHACRVANTPARVFAKRAFMGIGIATGTAACVWTAEKMPTKEPVKEPVDELCKWEPTPVQKARVVNLTNDNFVSFFVTCPLDADGVFVTGSVLDAHIQHHVDLDAHFPFSEAQHARVLDLATQAGTPGFLAKLIEHVPVGHPTADVDEYIEAHTPIAAEVEQQWKDCAGIRDRWWTYKHWDSDEVVPYNDRGSVSAMRIQEQREAHEADFPGAAAKREEIRCRGKEAEKRVEELVKAWTRKRALVCDDGCTVKF